MSRALRPYLECQADRVEAVLAAHYTPGRITGGTVGPRLLRFFLEPAPHVRNAAIISLADDLALAMDVPMLNVTRGKKGLVLEFANPQPRPVTLLDLLADAMPMPLATTVLGLTDDGAPLLARLSAPEVGHILISGTSGAGKSTLLRAIAAALAITHRSSLLQMVCIDPQGGTFQALREIPHLARPPIAHAPEALEALQSVARLLKQRGHYREVQREVAGTSAQRIVVLIDGLDDLIIAGQTPLRDTLQYLVQYGSQAGIHVIAAMQPVYSPLNDVPAMGFPLRIVGKMASASDARIAAGRAGTNAHLLNGHGDFLAVSQADNPIRFQGAYIEGGDLRQQMEMLRGSVTPYAIAISG